MPGLLKRIDMHTIYRNKRALLALAIGGFGIGLTEFVIMGILPEVADALEISIAEAGHFIAAYALGVVVGAPLLTSIFRRIPPRQVLLGLMGWFTCFNTLSAFATDYESLLATRFLSGLPHGAFFGIGAVVAGELAGKGKKAGAIALMFSGLTIANVIGVPAGTYLGQHIDWSWSFLLVGLVGLFTLLSLYSWMPVATMPVQQAPARILKKTGVWAMILLTTIGTGGFFAWYSYIAPLLTDVSGWPDSAVSYAMVLAGLGMVAGNFLGGYMASRLPALTAVIISLFTMVLVLSLTSLFATHAYLGMAMTFIVSMVAFTVATPIQMAIIQASHGSEMLGSSMNQSAFNMGNASGAYFAGLPIAAGYGVQSASMVGAGLALAGLFIALGIRYMELRGRVKHRPAYQS